jgi:hypothetical protein
MIAYGLASLVPLLMVIVGFVHFSHGTPDLTLRWLVVIFVPMIVVSFLAVFLVGAPTVWFLEKSKHLTLINLCLTGGIFGAILFVGALMIFGLTIGSSFREITFLQVIFGAIFGFATSLVFGLISRVPFR